MLLLLHLSLLMLLLKRAASGGGGVGTPECPPGDYYSYSYGCLPSCGAGSYYDGEECNDCPLGTYTEAVTATACTSCDPETPYTTAFGSTSPDACVNSTQLWEFIYPDQNFAPSPVDDGTVYPPVPAEDASSSDIQSAFDSYCSFYGKSYSDSDWYNAHLQAYTNTINNYYANFSDLTSSNVWDHLNDRADSLDPKGEPCVVYDSSNDYTVANIIPLSDLYGDPTNDVPPTAAQWSPSGCARGFYPLLYPDSKLDYRSATFREWDYQGTYPSCSTTNIWQASSYPATVVHTAVNQGDCANCWAWTSSSVLTAGALTNSARWGRILPWMRIESFLCPPSRGPICTILPSAFSMTFMLTPTLRQFCGSGRQERLATCGRGAPVRAMQSTMNSNRCQYGERQPTNTYFAYPPNARDGDMYHCPTFSDPPDAPCSMYETDYSHVLLPNGTYTDTCPARMAGTDPWVCLSNQDKWGQWTNVQTLPDTKIDTIKAALIQYGPLVAFLYDGAGWRLWSSLVMEAKDAALLGCATSQTPTHSVMIIGYTYLGDDTFWIIQNSYGRSWGDRGVAYMQAGINLCNIETWTPVVAEFPYRPSPS